MVLHEYTAEDLQEFERRKKHNTALLCALGRTLEVYMGLSVLIGFVIAASIPFAAVYMLWRLL